MRNGTKPLSRTLSANKACSKPQTERCPLKVVWPEKAKMTQPPLNRAYGWAPLYAVDVFFPKSQYESSSWKDNNGIQLTVWLLWWFSVTIKESQIYYQRQSSMFLVVKYITWVVSGPLFLGSPQSSGANEQSQQQQNRLWTTKVYIVERINHKGWDTAQQWI